jgi:hypothetical protein
LHDDTVQSPYVQPVVQLSPPVMGCVPAPFDMMQKRSVNVEHVLVHSGGFVVAQISQSIYMQSNRQEPRVLGHSQVSIGKPIAAMQSAAMIKNAKKQGRHPASRKRRKAIDFIRTSFFF